MGARNNRALREPKNKGAKAAALNKKFKKKPCSFCRDKVTYIDYKDIATLRKYISDRGKIRARRVTGACTQHQRAGGSGGAAAPASAESFNDDPWAAASTSPAGGGWGTSTTDEPPF